MSIQGANDYQTEHGAAYAGMPVNLVGNKFKSRVAASNVNFGIAVVREAGSERGCEPPSAANQDFLGVSVRTLEKQANQAGVIRYSANDEVNILEEGEIWVEVDETVTPGDPVFYRFSLGGTGAGAVGTFRTDADTGRGTQITHATFESSAVAGELAKVKIPVAIQD